MSIINNFRKYLRFSRALRESPQFAHAQAASAAECAKQPSRTGIINFLVTNFSRPTHYLEIGVRNPEHNFHQIKTAFKRSVDPGIEFAGYQADFPMTSDEFFAQWDEGKLDLPTSKFEVIFIDGLHLADQADRDIANALRRITDDGFVVVHDCNPPTEWHAREDYGFHLSPAGGNWNGTTWKAFIKWRQDPSLFSCCVDSDWGVGILSKSRPLGRPGTGHPEFYEYADLQADRRELLNLVNFDELKQRLAAP